MQRHLTLVAVAALAIGGFAFAAQAADEATTQPSQAQPPAAQVQIPPGIEVSRTQNDSAISSTLAHIADTTLTKNDLGKLAQYITQARTANIGDLSKLSDNRLNQVIDKVNTEWKNKYGKSFDASAANFTGANSDVRIVMGQITNPTLLSNWPLPPKAGAQPGPQGEGGAAQSNEQGLKGTDVAIVVFPAQEKLPELTASLIQQDGKWKVEIPENINGQQFQNNLVNELTAFANSPLPQDQNQAYRMATHHILAALYNVQAGH